LSQTIFKTKIHLSILDVLNFLKHFSAFLPFLAGACVVSRAELPVPLETERVAPVKVTTLGNEGIFADFGQDAYGSLEITFATEPSAGPVTVRLGEKISSSGGIDRNPPGSVNYREITLATKPGQRTYRLEIPRKPRHRDPSAVPIRPEIGEITPFRYAEIDRVGSNLEKVSVFQLAIHSPFDESLSDFDSSDPTLNAVWKLCKHTMKATSAFGIFIDGERERIPYEGDALINQRSFSACDPDPRLIRATFGRLIDHPTWPTEWGLDLPTIAVTDYMATGDPVIARKYYDKLKKLMVEHKTRSDGLLVAPAIVDWFPIERDGYNDNIASSTMPKMAGPEINTVANAFYCKALGEMAVLARALGKESDAIDFEEKERKVHTTFNAVFLDPATGLYIDGEGSRHSSLHANMFPLAFGLVPPERVSEIAAFVQSRGMACSVYGAQYLLEALLEAGCDRAALALMTAHTTRSWWHMMNAGSTMTWEAWDPSSKPNLTWNHAWGAAPANILSRYILGVRPLTPGYERISIEPHPGNLAWVRGKVPTIKGSVVVKLENGKTLHLQVTLPREVTAEVRFPENGCGKFLLDGRAVTVHLRVSGNGKDIRYFDISGGEHVIEFIPANSR
jgi:hypothetical protein